MTTSDINSVYRPASTAEGSHTLEDTRLLSHKLYQAGAGRAAGAANTPPPTNNALGKSGFNFDYYIPANISGDYSAEDARKVEQKLAKFQLAVAELLNALGGQKAQDEDPAIKGQDSGFDEDPTGGTGSTHSRRKPQDLMALLAQVINLERGLAIQRITNHALQNISELKAAAQEMRNSANKLMTGAILNLVFSVVASGMSAISSIGALRKANAASDATKKATTAQENIDGLSKQIDDAKGKLKSGNIPANTSKRGLNSDISSYKHQIKGLKDNVKQIQRGADDVATSSRAWSTMGESLVHLGGAVGRFGDAYHQAESKRKEADMAEHQANAQLEQATKDTMLQALNSLKSMVDALLNALREIRDTEDQARATIARNA